MTETLAPKVDGSTQPLDERRGYSLGVGATDSVGTSFTEGGLGLDLRLKCDIAENVNELYSPTAEISLDLTEGKYLPSSGYDPDGPTPAVPGYNTKRGSFILGFSRTTRSILSYGEGTNISTAFRTESTPLIGLGWRRQEQSGQTVDGVTSSFDDVDTRTINVAKDQRWAFETRPSGNRWTTYTFGLNFMLGSEYAGADSRHNRMVLKIGLSLTAGKGDAATEAGRGGDTSLGPAGEIYAYEVLLHSILSRYLTNEIISGQQSELNNYLGGDTSEGSGRGSQANIPLFTSADQFNNAFDGLSPMALRTDETTLVTIAIAKGLAGAAFIGSKSEAGSVGGGVDVMNSLRLGLFAFEGIDTAGKRQALRAKDESIVRKKEAGLNAVNFAANTLLMFLAPKVGASANMSVAGTPDPVQDGLVERTDYRYVLSLSDSQGSRGGLDIHSSFRDSPFYSAVRLVSPSLLPGNTANHVSQDDPYTNIGATSDVDASMGVEWRARFLRAYLGIDTKAIFGGDKNTQAGIGATAGIDLLLGSKKGWGFSVGANATAVRLFPGGGNQFELIPGFGFTVFQPIPKRQQRSDDGDDE